MSNSYKDGALYMSKREFDEAKNGDWIRAYHSSEMKPLQPSVLRYLTGVGRLLVRLATGTTRSLA